MPCKRMKIIEVNYAAYAKVRKVRIDASSAPRIHHVACCRRNHFFHETVPYPDESIVLYSALNPIFGDLREENIDPVDLGHS